MCLQVRESLTIWNSTPHHFKTRKLSYNLRTQNPDAGQCRARTTHTCRLRGPRAPTPSPPPTIQPTPPPPPHPTRRPDASDAPTTRRGLEPLPRVPRIPGSRPHGAWKERERPEELGNGASFIGLSVGPTRLKRALYFYGSMLGALAGRNAWFQAAEKIVPCEVRGKGFSRRASG